MARHPFGQNCLSQTKKNKATDNGPATKKAVKTAVHADAYPALAICCCQAG
jgi:hypothetical protein